MIESTFKDVLSGYHQNYNITYECTNVVRTQTTVEIDEKIIDHKDGDSVHEFHCSVPLPDVLLDNKVMINIARANRRVKVVASGNVIVIGNRANDEYSIEIRLQDAENPLNVMKKSTNAVIYPRKGIQEIKGKTKLMSAYNPFCFFSYYQNMKSEYFKTIPEIDSAEAKEDLDNLFNELRLSADVVKSLSVFVGSELISATSTEDIPMNPGIMQAILDLIDKRHELNEVTLPTDYKLGTVDNEIEEQVWRNRWRIQNKMLNSYTRSKEAHNGVAQDISLLELKQSMNKISAQGEDGPNIFQQETNTNALSVLSQMDKTYFKKKIYSDTGKFTGKEEAIRLDPRYFVGVIDPAYTADSNLINQKNSLARSAVVSNEGFKVRLYNKKFKEVTIDLFTYMMSTVLSSDNVDYVKKEIIPNEFGEYSVYNYGKYKYVKDISEIDYIRMQDSIISESTAILPFANKVIPMRLMIGTHMIADQALPVIGAKPSIVYTGVSKEIFKNSNQVVRAGVSGTVLGVGKKFANIDGKAVPLPQSEETAAHSTVTYNNTIKKGDTITEDAIIAQSNSFVDNEFSVNVPLFTAYTGWMGWEHEDSVIISESAAKKFGHLDTYELSIPIKYSKVTFPKLDNPNLDDINLIKTNAEVKEGDVLFAYNQVSTSLGVDVERLKVIRVPAHINGKVREVKFKLFESKRRQGVNKTKYMDFEGLPQLRAGFKNRLNEDIQKEAQSTGLNPILIAKDYQFEIEEPSLADSLFAEIRITIDYVNLAKIADKITNQYGGKGVIAKIVPDDEFLRTEDGRVVDIIMSPLAVLSRANLSQMYESLLSLICVEFYNILDKWYNGDAKVHSEFTEDTLQKALDMLMFETVGKNDLRKVYRESKKYGYIRVRVSSFDKHFTDSLLKEVRDMLHIKDVVKLYDPMLKTYIRTPIRIGYQNFYRLHFMSEKKMTVRGGNGGLMLRDKTPVIGDYGKIKATGQKIGEQELWALKAHGLNELSKSYVDKAGKREKLISDFLSLELILDEE